MDAPGRASLARLLAVVAHLHEQLQPTPDEAKAASSPPTALAARCVDTLLDLATASPAEEVKGEARRAPHWTARHGATMGVHNILAVHEELGNVGRLPCDEIALRSARLLVDEDDRIRAGSAAIVSSKLARV